MRTLEKTHCQIKKQSQQWKNLSSTHYTINKWYCFLLVTCSTLKNKTLISLIKNIFFKNEVLKLCSEKWAHCIIHSSVCGICATLKGNRNPVTAFSWGVVRRLKLWLGVWVWLSRSCYHPYKEMAFIFSYWLNVVLLLHWAS